MTNSPVIANKLSEVSSLDLKQLLGRQELHFDDIPIKQFFSGKCVMITGAAGSVGSELLKQMVTLQPSEIVLLDRSAELSKTPPMLDGKVRKFTADICDQSGVMRIFKDVRPDIVFHAAALKDVPTVESMHKQAVLVNIIGTENLVQASIQNGAQKFVFVSTDKAVNPASFMGATKRFGEMMMMHYTNQSTEFVTARFGNILGSSRSVIPVFLEQIKMNQPLTLTHPDMTRYLMTAFEAGQLLLETATKAKSGQIFIPCIGSPVYLTELIKRLSILVGKAVNITSTGIRPGEKLNEELTNQRDTILTSHHPEIQLAKINPADMCDISQFLQMFNTVIKEHSHDKLQGILQLAIPEYKPVT